MMTIKNITTALIFIISVLINVAYAAEQVYQCHIDKSTTFQDTPCPIGSVQENIVLDKPINGQDAATVPLSAPAPAVVNNPPASAPVVAAVPVTAPAKAATATVVATPQPTNADPFAPAIGKPIKPIISPNPAPSPPSGNNAQQQ